MCSVSWSPFIVVAPIQRPVAVGASLTLRVQMVCDLRCFHASSWPMSRKRNKGMRFLSRFASNYYVMNELIFLFMTFHCSINSVSLGGASHAMRVCCTYPIDFRCSITNYKSLWMINLLTGKLILRSCACTKNSEYRNGKCFLGAGDLLFCFWSIMIIGRSSLREYES